MLKIDFSNVEDVIFSKQDVRHVLPPYFANYFESWALAQRIPALRQLGRQAMFDLLNGLDDEQVLRLEEYFGQRIIIEKLNYSAVKNIKIPLHDFDLCRVLCDVVGDYYYSVWRDDCFVYISFWR